MSLGEAVAARITLWIRAIWLAVAALAGQWVRQKNQREP
jgi:hypothetical protein